MKVKLLKKIRKKYIIGWNGECKQWYYVDRYLRNGEYADISYWPYSWDVIFNTAIRFVGEDKALNWRQRKITRDLK